MQTPNNMLIQQKKKTRCLLMAIPELRIQVSLSKDRQFHADSTRFFQFGSVELDSLFIFSAEADNGQMQTECRQLP